MSEYKRLTNKDWKEQYGIFEDVSGDTCSEDCGQCERNFNALVRLAELEDKIESGYLLELPCKVGDTVYVLRFGEGSQWRVEEDKIIGIDILQRTIMMHGRYGHAYSEVFTTKEAAETRLKELQEKQK